MFYLNTIEQLFLFIEQLNQLEVCLPYTRILTGIPMLAIFQNSRWNSNKTSLCKICIHACECNVQAVNEFLSRDNLYVGDPRSWMSPQSAGP